MHLNENFKCGHLAADPILTKDPGGDDKKDRCWFRIGVNRPKSKHADFFAVVCWGALARAVAECCSVGKEVIVRGSDRTRPQEVKVGGEVVLGDNGKPLMQNYQEIVAHNISFGQESFKKREAASVAAGTDTKALVEVAVAQALAAQQEAAKTSNETPAEEPASSVTAEDCPFVEPGQDE